MIIPVKPNADSNHYLFLSWFNNFLSIERFAEYCDVANKRAERIIIKGRAIHESQFGSIL